MDPAQIDRVEKLEKVYDAVCDFIRHSGIYQFELRDVYWSSAEDDIMSLRGKVQEIMGVEIEEYT